MSLGPKHRAATSCDAALLLRYQARGAGTLPACCKYNILRPPSVRVLCQYIGIVRRPFLIAAHAMRAILALSMLLLDSALTVANRIRADGMRTSVYRLLFATAVRPNDITLKPRAVVIACVTNRVLVYEPK